MRPSDLLSLTPQGLYCPIADVHIDPVQPVARALITHGHADHARAGHGAVLATRETLDIMAVRYGEDFTPSRQVANLGEPVSINGVSFTFHAAGHVLGSAQIAVDARGLRIVASGDYKRAPDLTCATFEPIACDVFITEATFGLPVFRHPDTGHEVDKLLASLQLFPERAHLVGAYALGKAQRLVSLIRQRGYDQPIYIHGAMEKLMAFYEAQGVAMGDIRKVPMADRKRTQTSSLAGQIILCPPSSLQDVWSRRFPDPVAAFASGWMRVRARARQKGVELPLVVSDHADWDGLTQTIRDTGAGEIWVTHGEADGLVHWCTTQGINAMPLNMLGYGGEGDGSDSAEAEPPADSAKAANDGSEPAGAATSIGPLLP